MYDEDPERDEIKAETALFAEEELPAEANVLAKYEYEGEPNVQNSINVPDVQDVPKVPPQEELLADKVRVHDIKKNQILFSIPLKEPGS